MREYLLGVICAAFLCSIVNAIGGEGRGTRRLVSGLFLALALFHPLGTLELPDLRLDSILEQAEDAACDGMELASAERNEIISKSLEAYILTEAARLGLTIDVRVTIIDEGLPDSVTITGAASPSERNTLATIIEKDLGIGKEDLHWTSYPQRDE